MKNIPYIPIVKLLNTTNEANTNKEYQLDKILNTAKAQQRIADMDVLEMKIERLEKTNATSQQIINELRFFLLERKAIASAIKKQI